jgi:hypothetical protein
LTGCAIHINFFDDTCSECKKEYAKLKGLNEAHLDNDNKSKTEKNRQKKYKEFSEERAKKLYEDLLLQFLRSNYNEIDASEKARSVIRKQCNLRGMPYWSWI